jgi:hypothetical protein
MVRMPQRSLLYKVGSIFIKKQQLFDKDTPPTGSKIIIR